MIELQRLFKLAVSHLHKCNFYYQNVMNIVLLYDARVPFATLYILRTKAKIMQLLQERRTARATIAPRLPLAGPLNLSFVQSMPERLYPLLALPGESIATSWYGAETLIRFEGNILVMENKTFRRYVYGLVEAVAYIDGELKPCIPGSRPLGTAALEVRKASSLRSRPLLERIFVMPNLRRQGIASRLLKSATADFPKLALDGKLTREGAAFFGYALDAA